MNKTFTRFFAGALAAASLFALASCGEKKDGDDKSANASTPAPITEAPSVTDEPTAAPTEAPTPEPTETPEPTATPIPEGWYIDPRGIIPPEVEVIIPDDGDPAREEAFCIANVEGATVLQYWTKDGLQKEWRVPAEMAEPDKGIHIEAGMNTFQKGDIFCSRNFTNDPFSGSYWFYQDAQGRTLFFECEDGYGWPGGIILATTDGKAIWYTWGDDFYLYHDYGTDAEVEVSNGWIIVNGGEDGGLPEDIQWTKKQL